MKRIYTEAVNIENTMNSGGNNMTYRKLLGICAISVFILNGYTIMNLSKAESEIITLTAKLTIKEGKEKEFEAMMKEVVPKVRAEEGNLTYTMCRSKDNPRAFLFFEEYADQEAVQAHGQHLGELGIDFASYFDGPPVAEYYEKIAE